MPFCDVKYHDYHRINDYFSQMISSISYEGKTLKVDLSKPIDVSIPLRADRHNPKAWYVDPPRIEAVRTEAFTGSVAEGGSVNFRDIYFNPHGHGTHTECVGHIAPEVYSINQHLKQFFFWSELVSIRPERLENEDQIITAAQVEKAIQHNSPELKALLIRTLPNSDDKLSRQYSDSNPPYLSQEAMQLIVDAGIEHLLLDLPSVDREVDGGKLAAHHTFWEFPEKMMLHKSITEMIYVPSEVPDGLYLLNLQFAPFENDASPSKPILYSTF